MQFELEKRAEGMTDQELLDEVSNVANTLDKDTLTVDEFNDHSELDSRSLTKRLQGNWGEVLLKAGLKKKYHYGLSKEELFQNLADTWINLGKQPRIEQMTRPNSDIVGKTYQHHFGSWTNALREFIQYQDDGKLDTTQSIETSIQIFPNHKTKRNPSDRLRFFVMKRDNFMCTRCGDSPSKTFGCELQVDHIIPYSTGGETVLENLRTLCKSCNMGRSNSEST